VWWDGEGVESVEFSEEAHSLFEKVPLISFLWENYTIVCRERPFFPKKGLDSSAFIPCAA
jgi:hypothetical protein